jgi:hypothetical protein
VDRGLGRLNVDPRPDGEDQPHRTSPRQDLIPERPPRAGRKNPKIAVGARWRVVGPQRFDELITRDGATPIDGEIPE